LPFTFQLPFSGGSGTHYRLIGGAPAEAANSIRNKGGRGAVVVAANKMLVFKDRLHKLNSIPDFLRK